MRCLSHSVSMPSHIMSKPILLSILMIPERRITPLSLSRHCLAKLQSSLIVSAGRVAIRLSEEYPEPKSSTSMVNPCLRSSLAVSSIKSTDSIKVVSVISSSIRRDGISYFFWRASILSISPGFRNCILDILSETGFTLPPLSIHLRMSANVFS